MFADRGDTPAFEDCPTMPSLPPPAFINWKAWRAIAAPALCAGVLAACATTLGTDPNATSSLGETGAIDAASARPARIAMLLPLGGMDQTAAIAKGLKQAGEMALFELDKRNVQLIVKNDKGTSEGARAAAEEALGEGAEIILGPLLAKAVPGAAAVARRAGVPLLAFSNDRTVAGNGVYLMSFPVEQEVERIVTFAASQGKSRFAALIPDNAYGKVVEPAFRNAVVRAGATIAALETYPVHENAMLRPAKRVLDAIKTSEDTDAPIDALLVAGGPEALPQLASLITYSGIDTTRVKLLGTGAWEYPSIGREAAFAGGWYPGPDPRGWQEFSTRFAKSFGSAPPRLASLAHDAVALAVLLSAHPPGQRFTAAALTRPSGFIGEDGLVRFLPSGLPERALAVLEVQAFGSQVVDPAPGEFDTASRISAVPGPAAN
ncbi:MAG TPA: penicillin-binding protein activator [Hyphomicrobiaceae bacterium]|nr:penicillin-binding protein activator [Hyphomicrobiaceae bacterium]